MDRRSTCMAMRAGLDAAHHARRAGDEVCRASLPGTGGMMASSSHNRTGSTRSACPPHVFDQLTDILAELVLEDIKQYPQILTCPRIDRFDGRENTVLLARKDGA